MVQATEDGAGADLPAEPPRRRHGGFQTESPVRAILLVVGEKLGQHCSEVLLAEDEQMVETLAAEGAHDPLADRVRVGGLDGRPKTLDADRCRLAGEVGAVDAIAVVDQVAGLPAPGGGFNQLAPNPVRGRMRGHLVVEQLAAAVADEEQHMRVRKRRVWTTNRSAAQMAWA